MPFPALALTHCLLGGIGFPFFWGGAGKDDATSGVYKMEGLGIQHGTAQNCSVVVGSQAEEHARPFGWYPHSDAACTVDADRAAHCILRWGNAPIEGVSLVPQTGISGGVWQVSGLRLFLRTLAHWSQEGQLWWFCRLQAAQCFFGQATGLRT